MKKSDLKTGMVLETVDGRRTMVMLNTSDGDKCGAMEDDRNCTWSPLSEWEEDLTASREEMTIVKVYDSGPSNMELLSLTRTGELLWERPAQTYKRGDVFVEINRNEQYILTQVSSNEFCLVCIKSGLQKFLLGNRYKEPIMVCDNSAITIEELKEMAGDLTLELI